MFWFFSIKSVMAGSIFIVAAFVDAQCLAQSIVFVE